MHYVARQVKVSRICRRTDCRCDASTRSQGLRLASAVRSTLLDLMWWGIAAEDVEPDERLYREQCTRLTNRIAKCSLFPASPSHGHVRTCQRGNVKVASDDPPRR